MNRRDFLRGTTVTGAATVVPPVGLLFNSTEANAFVWFGVIMIAAAAASTVSAFTNRGDGGLGAYLASIRELQLETLQQLTAIRGDIVKLHAEIREIPEKIEGLLDQTSTNLLEAQLGAAFDEFRECVALRSTARPLTEREKQQLQRSNEH